MNIKVMYHSMTGNTKKVAEAIAEASGTQAQPIPGDGIKDTVDVLFIGDGVYAAKPDIRTVDFIKSLDTNKVKNAAVFGTYGGQKKAILKLAEMLREQGINVMEESFSCRGKAWFFINRRHPDEKELALAKEFSKHIIEKASGQDKKEG